MSIHRACMLLLTVFALSSVIDAQQFVVLSGNNVLSTINASAPGMPIAAVNVTGLAGGETLLGVDFRPATGQLYGLGSTSRLYTIDLMTGAATAIGGGSFTPALNGTRFGFDFNPTVDRIRVVSDAGQNLRLHPDLGTVAATDPNLAFAASDINAGVTPMVSGAGYTNSVAGATTTTLYDIDTGRDILVTQNPANAGVLNTVGSLGVNVAEAAGFEIDGLTTNAYAAFITAGNQTGSASLFNISLVTGAASFVGTIGVAAPVRGLSVIPGMLQMQPAAETIVALTDGGMLVTIDSRVPGAVFRIVAVSGLQPGETLVGVDYRPANRVLYGVGDTSRLYTVDLESGVATPVSGVPFTTPLAGTRFGVDFNPVVDLLRIVSDANQNLRVSPVTGAIVGVDGSLAFAAADQNAGIDPNAAGAAYANNVAGATSTTLYDIDFALDALVTQTPANAGTLQTVGSLGVNATGTLGFDISGTNGVAYAALRTGGSGVTTSELFRINLGTGQASFIGSIGFPALVRGLTVVPNPGVTTYGNGTQGCNGPIAISADSEPRIGNAGFMVCAANAPANAFGGIIISDEPAGMGETLAGSIRLVSNTSAFVTTIVAPSTLFGNSTVSLPIPNVVSLVGTVGYAQWFFIDLCGSPLGVASSNALAVTVQP